MLAAVLHLFTCLYKENKITLDKNASFWYPINAMKRLHLEGLFNLTRLGMKPSRFFIAPRRDILFMEVMR